MCDCDKKCVVCYICLLCNPEKIEEPQFKCEMPHLLCEDCNFELFDIKLLNAKCPICRAEIKYPDMIAELYAVAVSDDEIPPLQ